MAISDDGTLQVLLRLPTLLHPKIDELKEAIHREADAFLQEWRKEHSDIDDIPHTVNVEAMASTPVSMTGRLLEDPEDFLKTQGPGLAEVSHFLAVYSCKGGVGKSTVAVNLAYELARLGGRIGLLDLDVYGPSLPILVKPEDTAIRRSEKGKGMVLPIEHKGVKLLSLGFVNRSSGVPGSGPDNGAAIMRGPMAGKVVEQLLKGTDWGPLDVLILDLPPGTGDVQLQVCQDLSLSGAVAVTTPSKLSVEDTRKGIEMFTSLGVPTLSVVQNMSYFEVGHFELFYLYAQDSMKCCLSPRMFSFPMQSDDGKKHFPLGKGIIGAERLGGISPEKVIEMPLSIFTCDSNDSGNPLVLSRPEGASRELDAYHTLAQDVSGELLHTFYGTSETVENVKFRDSSEEFAVASVDLSLDKMSKEFIVRLYNPSGALQRRVLAAQLRARDPRTGDVIEDSPFLHEGGEKPPAIKIHKTTDRVSPSIDPNGVERKGRYGFAVKWGDGATIIYSKKSIARAAGGIGTVLRRTFMSAAARRPFTANDRPSFQQGPLGQQRQTSQPFSNKPKQTVSAPNNEVSLLPELTKAFGIGTLAGLLGSLAGMGGGFVMIPLMTSSLLRLSQHQAHGTSLFAVAATGIAGAFSYGSAVLWEPAAAVAVTGMATARLGAQATTVLSETALKRSLGVLMIVMSVAVPVKAHIMEQYQESESHTVVHSSKNGGSDSSDEENPSSTMLRVLERAAPAAAIGSCSGFMAGLFGVGGVSMVLQYVSLRH
jgi:Mrp family chromosome partitioning ATPase/uncharacterized membrane protein YfcA